MSGRQIERLLQPVLRRSGWKRLAARLAAVRGRDLVLNYHALVEDVSAAAMAASPALTPRAFREQLEALSEVGDIVPLPQLLQAQGPGPRPRFAVTFDDDHPAHAGLAVPVLSALNVAATFFLSGRVLHGLEPYWWNVLERAVAECGLPYVARQIGVPEPRNVTRLAAEIEARADLRERVRRLQTASSVPQLSAEEIRRIAHQGMEIGFHTLHHPVLPTLSDADLEAALQLGRHELASLIGRSVDLFAYPHGKADLRVAHRVKAAGYTAAFVSGGRPIDPQSNPHLLGRWEPGRVDPAALVTGALLRLHRPTGVLPG